MLPTALCFCVVHRSQVVAATEEAPSTVSLCKGRPSPVHGALQVGNMLLHGWLAALRVLKVAACGEGQLPPLPPPREAPYEEPEESNAFLEARKERRGRQQQQRGRLGGRRGREAGHPNRPAGSAWWLSKPVDL
jgi:hypothetical protein